MKQIYRFDAGKTRKSEFQTMFNSMIRIADTFDVEALHISETLNKMKEASPQVDNLNLVERKTPLTKKLREDRKKRNDYVSSIAMLAKGQLKSDEAANIAAAEVLLPVVEKYLSNFGRKSYNAQFSFAKQFIDKVEADNTLKQAFITLGLDATFTKLKAIQETVTTTHDSRIDVTSKFIKMNSAQYKRNLYRLMTNFFTAIEGASLEYPALDYTSLINKLNNVIVLQRTTDSVRQTRAAKLNTITSVEVTTETKVG